jgi:general secretion pathway protein J
MRERTMPGGASGWSGRAGQAGFTLMEMLIALVLMGFILAALATVTAQWLPNWNRGMARVQQAERLAFGLKRMAEDLSVAEFVTANSAAKVPMFEGHELNVTFVRTAIGPNSRPGLEIVRFHEVADANGPALVRDRTPFTPLPPGAVLQFADPVVLIRPPYRVMFSYAGPDGIWQPIWREDAKLPHSIRIAVRDGVTQQTLALSTATLVHTDAPAACVRSKSLSQCLSPNAQPESSAPQGEANAAQANAAPK